MNNILSEAALHNAGLKIVYLSTEERDCAITQIADTDLKIEKVKKAHAHDDVQESFYVMRDKWRIEG